MSDNDRPLKRARLSDADSSTDLPDSSTSADTPNTFKPHHEFWLPDGNIILVTRATGFRVYRGLIAAQSTIFEDIFASSSTDPNEIFNGCPVVHLSDSPEDLVHLVRVLLPKSQRLYNRPDLRSFSEVSALVRLAHKYHIQDVQDQALDVLKESIFSSRFALLETPSTIMGMRTNQCIGVISLARLTDTPSILPGAFYVCAYLGSQVLDGWTREDGTVEHLSTADLRRCIDGYRALTLETALLPGRILAGGQVVGCSTPARCPVSCREVLLRLVNSKRNNENRQALNSWNAAIAKMAAGKETGATKICRVCEKELLRRARHERFLVWKKLPEIFGITVNGWGTHEDEDGDGDGHEG